MISTKLLTDYTYYSHKKTFVFFITILTILISLGLWQLKKLEFKKQYIKSVYNGISKPPVDIDSLSELQEYKNVVVKGEFLIDKTQFLYRRHPIAKYEDGSYVLVPIKTEKGSIYLVVLGWVAKKNHDSLLKEIHGKQNIELSGLLIPQERNSIFIPKNDYTKKIIFTMDVEEIDGEIGTEKRKFFLATLNIKDKLDTQILPITSSMMVKVKNDHFEYAITWFSLAVALCFIFSFYMKKVMKNIL